MTNPTHVRVRVYGSLELCLDLPVPLDPQLMVKLLFSPGTQRIDIDWPPIG